MSRREREHTAVWPTVALALGAAALAAIIARVCYELLRGVAWLVRRGT